MNRQERADLIFGKFKKGQTFETKELIKAGLNKSTAWSFLKEYRDLGHIKTVDGERRNGGGFLYQIVSRPKKVSLNREFPIEPDVAKGRELLTRAWV